MRNWFTNARWSNIHEYVAATIKKLIVINLEPVISKIRYGFEGKRFCRRYLQNHKISSLFMQALYSKWHESDWLLNCFRCKHLFISLFSIYGFLYQLSMSFLYCIELFLWFLSLTYWQSLCSSGDDIDVEKLRLYAKYGACCALVVEQFCHIDSMQIWGLQCKYCSVGVVLAFYAGATPRLPKMLCAFCSPNQNWQEASASERLLVFAWITGLPRIPSQGDMSIILQASHWVGVEMNAAQ